MVVTCIMEAKECVLQVEPHVPGDYIHVLSRDRHDMIEYTITTFQKQTECRGSVHIGLDTLLTFVWRCGTCGL